MNTAQLASTLSAAGIPFTAGPDDTQVCVFRTTTAPICVAAKVTPKGSGVQLRTVNLLKDETGTHRTALYRAALTHNYARKVVKLSVDPLDGEVVAYVDLPLGGAPPTAKQFARCARQLATDAALARERYRTLIDTGRDPGEAEGGRMTEALLWAAMHPSR